MSSDRTTKTLIAVIAASLAVIALADLGLIGPGPVGPAWAAGTGQNVVVTNFRTRRIGLSQVLEVYCTNCK